MYIILFAIIQILLFSHMILIINLKIQFRENIPLFYDFMHCIIFFRFLLFFLCVFHILSLQLSKYFFSYLSQPIALCDCISIFLILYIHF